MESAGTILFDYLRDTIYDSENASLDIDKLPEQLQEFGGGLNYYAQCVSEAKTLAFDLSKGLLDGKLPSRNNELAAPLKSLHASLRHLTWQTKRIAKGDYNQRVAFMGEFADAFNMMITQLAEREQNLEDKIKQIEEKTSALEQGNLLLTTLIHYIPQQIFVIDKKTRKVLLTNSIALNELEQNASYLDDVASLISDNTGSFSGNEVGIEYEINGSLRYLIINRFFLEWHGYDAEVYAILDVSEARKELADLETHAYKDSLTNLYNRAYGMMLLNLWLREKRKFALVFADLDSLKYVNDVYGHAEGDIYIIRSSEHLMTFSPDAVVCRVGGDEFMLLAEGYGFDDALDKMNEIAINLRNDEYQRDKDYTYNISFGISTGDKEINMSAGDILRVTDLRMYDDKKRNKQKSRQLDTV